MEKPEFFVVVTEHDCPQSDFPRMQHASNGSIVQETYLKDAALFRAVERRASIGNKYGKVAIAKLVFLTEQEIENHFKKGTE